MISEIFPDNVITIDMFGKAFYQTQPFYAVSHGRINILIPKIKFNKSLGLFFTSIFNKLFDGKYSFSVMCSQSKLKQEKLYLPVKDDGTPDWEWMENYIKNLYNEIEEKVV